MRLSKIGVLEEIPFDIEEVGKPIKFTWGKCPLATASFGHGITTTFAMVGETIILSKILGQSFSNCTTAIKGERSRKRVICTAVIV